MKISFSKILEIKQTIIYEDKKKENKKLWSNFNDTTYIKIRKEINNKWFHEKKNINLNNLCNIDIEKIKEAVNINGKDAYTDDNLNIRAKEFCINLGNQCDDSKGICYTTDIRGLLCYKFGYKDMSEDQILDKLEQYNNYGIPINIYERLVKKEKIKKAVLKAIKRKKLLGKGFQKFEEVNSFKIYGFCIPDQVYRQVSFFSCPEQPHLIKQTILWDPKLRSLNSIFPYIPFSKRNLELFETFDIYKIKSDYDEILSILSEDPILLYVFKYNLARYLTNKSVQGDYLSLIKLLNIKKFSEIKDEFIEDVKLPELTFIFATFDEINRLLAEKVYSLEQRLIQHIYAKHADKLDDKPFMLDRNVLNTEYLDYFNKLFSISTLWDGIFKWKEVNLKINEINKNINFSNFIGLLICFLSPHIPWLSGLFMDNLSSPSELILFYLALFLNFSVISEFEVLNLISSINKMKRERDDILFNTCKEGKFKNLFDSVDDNEQYIKHLSVYRISHSLVQGTRIFPASELKKTFDSVAWWTFSHKRCNMEKFFNASDDFFYYNRAILGIRYSINQEESFCRSKFYTSYVSKLVTPEIIKKSNELLDEETEKQLLHNSRSMKLRYFKTVLRCTVYLSVMVIIVILNIF